MEKVLVNDVEGRYVGGKEMNQLVFYVPVAILLGFSMWTDIKKKMISGILLGTFAVIGVVMLLIFRQKSIWSVVTGILPGVAIMGISRLTRGEIGMGDGALLCVTGLFVGFYVNLEMFFIALFMAAVWGMILVMFKKAGRKTELPFAPFMMMAYIIVIISRLHQVYVQ